MGLALCVALSACGEEARPVDAPSPAPDAGADALDADGDDLGDLDLGVDAPADQDAAPGDVADDPAAEEVPDAGPVAWPMGPLAAQGPWGPAGRVVWLDSPETAQEARQAGCALEGASGGTSLNSLVTLAGGLPPLVRPGAQGEVTLNLLVRLEGWAPGERAEELDAVDLSVLTGVTALEPSVRVDAAASFEGGDPARPPHNRYPASEVNEGWLRSTEGRFTFAFSILGLPLRLSMSKARLVGRVYADGPGVGMREGALMGYLSSQDILDTLRGLIQACDAPSPPAICGALRGLIPADATDEALLQVGTSFIGALDTALDEQGHPYPCDPQAPGACNAMSACFLLHLDGVEIGGVEAP
jgi:hypothetical protein